MKINLVEPIELYAYATNLAQKNNQVVGKKHDYYITLWQLETLLSIWEKPNNDDLRKM